MEDAGFKWFGLASYQYQTCGRLEPDIETSLSPKLEILSPIIPLPVSSRM